MLFGISQRIEEDIKFTRTIRKGIEKVKYDTQKTQKSIADVL